MGMKSKLKNIAQALGFLGMDLLVSGLIAIVYTIIIGIMNPTLEGAALEQVMEQSLKQNEGILGISTALIVLGSLWLLSRRSKQEFSTYIQLNAGNYGRRNALLAIALAIALSFTIVCALNQLPIPAHLLAEAEEAGFHLEGIALIPGLLYIIIAAPIVEEILFRGLILDRLRRAMPTAAAVAISSVLFGLLHLMTLQMIWAAAVGVVLAIVKIKTGSLRVTILIHICINALSVVTGLLPAGTVSIIVAIVSLATIIICVRKLERPTELAAVAEAEQQWNPYEEGDRL